MYSFRRIRFSWSLLIIVCSGVAEVELNFHVGYVLYMILVYTHPTETNKPKN
jgi:hypothetical protein